ncbi:MAG: alanine--tRNA ligase [Erysipelotrichaceae bacterium]|nr:alanine--tRNA ligase [Erysipelotrichaceae bacterium]
MKKLTGNQVRQMFLDYFAENGHMIEPGASLVPINDPTLLWINAGVAALKKYFDGREKPRCNRICNAQKSIRTNDIENVGKTARHHTFFEMLGNFSIGDYFKEEALKFAWGFLTDPKWIGFDPKRIYVTVYPDDVEAYDIWTKKIGIDPTHILKTYDNFWQIGEGPSGPDSEIFYDRGPKYDPQGLGEKLFFEEMENDRYIEVWNVVFSQYDAKEGVDRKDFKELPQKNIDTGMGLERLVALIQDGETNFDTDLFLPIINEMEKIAKYSYDGEYKMAYRVIADHIRTVTFALSDGASFSNEGRGYVLRRVLRRAIRYNIKLGVNEPCIYKLTDVVVENMKEFYPYLVEKIDFVKNQIKKEEETFYQTLKHGEKLLNEAIEAAKDTKILKGEVIFKLYDTYGYPKEITFEVASDAGLKIDYEGFEACMTKQKELARNSRSAQESMHNQSQDLLSYEDDFKFTGYQNYRGEATVLKLIKDGNFVETIKDKGAIILDQSCFYAESGGQIADTGRIFNDEIELKVVDVKKAPHGQFIHFVEVIKGEIIEGLKVKLAIDEERRIKIMANHSSLHLLHSALRNILGTHVAQAGSYVCEDYARFDFSHFEKIDYETLNKIERQVNDFITQGYPITTKVLALDEAKKEDAIALFDEKYEDLVRIVTMGTASKEFCGGTHAANTKDLGIFKIINEESIGSGIRRIECKTKIAAYEEFKNYEDTLINISETLKLKGLNGVVDKIDSLVNSNNELMKKYRDLEAKMLNIQADLLIGKIQEHKKIKYLLTTVEAGVNLKDFANIIKSKVQDAVIFLAMIDGEKITFAAACGKKAIEGGIRAGQLVRHAASMCDGKGGGKDDLAMSGGKNITEIDEIFKEIAKIIIEH